MGDVMRGGATLSPDHVRIESTLDWYLNFADVDLGLRSNHAATVAYLNNPVSVWSRALTPPRRLCFELSTR